MAGKTQTMPVTAAADLPVIALGYTALIQVAEDPSVTNWPTCSFVVKKPTSLDTAIAVPSGTSYTFSKGCHYAPGEIVGYIRLAAGSSPTTFQQDEQ